MEPFRNGCYSTFTSSLLKSDVQYDSIIIMSTCVNVVNNIIFFFSLKFVHRKICSYNIWITNENKVKIGCFGNVFNDHGKEVDLSRWSAPEVLRFQHYTTQSDVWSFGCLIWECLSVGATLYSKVNSNDLTSRISHGLLPERISYVQDDMQQLLLNCWQMEPSERTTFSEITSILWQFISSPHHILSFKIGGENVLPYLPLLEMRN